MRHKAPAVCCLKTVKILFGEPLTQCGKQAHQASAVCYDCRLVNTAAHGVLRNLLHGAFEPLGKLLPAFAPATSAPTPKME